jgi:hypothetical protein
MLLGKIGCERVVPLGLSFLASLWPHPLVATVTLQILDVNPPDRSYRADRIEQTSLPFHGTKVDRWPPNTKQG